MHSADLPDGLVVADGQRRVIELNPVAAAMLKVVREEVIGSPIAQVLRLDDHQGNFWYESLRPYDGLSTRIRFTEGQWFASDGSVILVTARLRRDYPCGPVTKLVVSLRDAKSRARQDRERSDMVATIAHELRSPLTGVKGFTSTLLRRWDRFSDEQRQYMLETVDADADRLVRLITALLDAARLDSGRLTLRVSEIDLGEVVQRVLDNISAGIGERLTLKAEGAQARIWADDDRLTQVITNIVENALTHGVGIESIAVQAPSGERDGVVFEVVDHGPGIDPDIRNRVFNRFWKGGQGQGSGLGLYIVKGIIDMHHGEIEFENLPTGMATRVWLPTNTPAVLHT